MTSIQRPSQTPVFPRLVIHEGGHGTSEKGKDGAIILATSELKGVVVFAPKDSIFKLGTPNNYLNYDAGNYDMECWKRFEGELILKN